LLGRRDGQLSGYGQLVIVEGGLSQVGWIIGGQGAVLTHRAFNLARMQNGRAMYRIRRGAATRSSSGAGAVSSRPPAAGRGGSAAPCKRLLRQAVAGEEQIDRPHFEDGADAGQAAGDLEGVIQGVAVDDIEPEQLFLGFRKG